MESWCFDSLDKGFVSTDILSTSDSIDRLRGEFRGWESKPSFSYENIGSFPSQQFIENPSFPGMGIAEIMYDYPSFGDVVSPGLVNSSSNDEESSSKVSSTVIDSNSQESSLIKLKSDGFGDKPDSNSTRTAHVLSSEESSAPPKRARTTSLSPQTVYCQVYGCRKDLSSAKDYHKRHKVCDVHSKTSEVIVNGVEQRFCQQCSRFHLLGEFDGGKRSCRKRLAGHNERRRKPQVGITSKCGSSLRSYTGSNFQRFNPRSPSSICQNMLPRGTSHMEKHESNDLVRHIKIEGRTICTGKPAHNPFNEHLRPKSTSFPSTFEKQFPSINNTNQNNNHPRTVLEEKLDLFTPELVSQFMFQTNSSGGEDLALLDKVSTIKGLSGISESSSALSLLSSKSRVSSIPSNDPPYNVNEVSENGYPLFMSNHTGESLTHQSSKFINIRDGLWCEDRDTIDLVQLSSQFSRVENQRQFEIIKQEETEGFLTENDMRSRIRYDSR